MSRKHKDIRKIEPDAGLSGGVFLNSYKPFVWIFFAGFLLYFRTVFFSFNYLDDNALVLDRFNFISAASNILNFFREDVFHPHLGGSYYRPMPAVSFMLDALWGGKNPGAYHFTNVLLHLFVCCLLFRTLVKLNYNRATSFFYALFFTVHPVLTQAVAWIQGRTDILLAFFALLSFISFLSFLEGRKRAQLAAHLLFLLLALLTKENAVFLCALGAFFVVFMKEGKPQCGVPSVADNARGPRQASVTVADNARGPRPPKADGATAVEKGSGKPLEGSNFPLWAGWGLVVLGWFLARGAVLKTAAGNSDFNIMKSLTENFPAVVSYAGKIFFPFNLGIMPVLKDLPMWYGVCAGILTGGLIYISAAKRRSYIAFGLFWFLLFLLPSFMRSASAVPDFSEHRIYLPLIGFIFLFAELDIPGIFKLSKRGSLAPGAGVLLLFSLIAFFYCGNFRDKISFWKKAVESSPSYAFSCNNLGSMYYLEGDLPDAESMWKKAASINPGERLVHSNLGLIYMNSGKFKDAEEEYLKEIKLNPLYDNVYLNLGLLYYNGGFIDKAELYWEMALQINPDFARVYANLAFLNYQKKDVGKAKFYIEQMRKRGFYVPPELLKAVTAIKKR